MLFCLLVMDYYEKDQTVDSESANEPSPPLSAAEGYGTIYILLSTMAQMKVWEGEGGEDEGEKCGELMARTNLPIVEGYLMIGREEGVVIKEKIAEIRLGRRGREGGGSRRKEEE